jgi:hypothetical protein
MIRFLPTRATAMTSLRILACLVLAWLFAAGTSLLSFNGVTILAAVTLLSLLAVYELNIRDIGDEWVAATVAAILLVGGACYGLWSITRPPAYTGPLTPGADPSPPMTCKETAGKGDLVMAFGTDRVIGHGDGPFMPVIVDDCQSIALRKTKGGLMVRAFFYDWTNDIAMNVMDNKFEVNMPVSARFFRPDPHTLVVLDRFDSEILYVRYLNPGAVRIRGRFLCAEQPQAIISDHVILTGGVRVQGAYMGTHPAPGHKCARIPSGGEGIRIGP